MEVGVKCARCCVVPWAASGHLCAFRNERRRCKGVHKHPSWYPGGLCDPFGSIDVYEQAKPRARRKLVTPRAECACRFDESSRLFAAPCLRWHPGGLRCASC